MKANSRRRVLISSLAMLLVALVALSTATYAWFTASTVATAKGINVRTSQASELQISKNDLQWGTLVNYNVSNKLLLPVSSANGTSWFTADAAAATASTLKEGTIASQTDLGSYVIRDQINVQNIGDAAVENVTISLSVPNNYLRVAIVPAAAGGPTAGIAEGTSFADYIFDSDNEAYSALTSTTGTAQAITTRNAANAALNSDDDDSNDVDNVYSINVGTLTKNQAKYYNLYVWFEGQDAQCYDANAGATVTDIEITVTGDTVVA